MGSGYDFDIELHSGAGAYVCGEETALFESIEGNRGELRFRPPYPGTKDLFGKPTALNNVETLANIPPILLNGCRVVPAVFALQNSPEPNCLLFAEMSIKRGVFEFPMGVNLKDILYDVCGGVADGELLADKQAAAPRDYQSGSN